MEDTQQYLQATQSIESDNPRIIKLAAEICGDTDDIHEKARRLFLHVRDEIKYTVYAPMYPESQYKAYTIIERGLGYCVQKAVVLCALARAAGIPARLVFADIKNYAVPETLIEFMGSNLFTYHCYSEMYLGDKWVQMTPAFDKGLSENHGFPLVEFDGYQNAIFAPTDAQGNKFVEYVKHYGSFADVPFGPMLQSWEDTYGKERMDLWKKASEMGSMSGRNGGF
jgi:transglutaminase-like putative cysteine protease